MGRSLPRQGARKGASLPRWHRCACIVRSFRPRLSPTVRAPHPALRATFSKSAYGADWRRQAGHRRFLLQRRSWRLEKVPAGRMRRAAGANAWPKRAQLGICGRPGAFGFVPHVRRRRLIRRLILVHAAGAATRAAVSRSLRRPTGRAADAWGRTLGFVPRFRRRSLIRKMKTGMARSPWVRSSSSPRSLLISHGLSQTTPRLPVPGRAATLRAPSAGHEPLLSPLSVPGRAPVRGRTVLLPGSPGCGR